MTGTAGERGPVLGRDHVEETDDLGWSTGSPDWRDCSCSSFAKYDANKYTSCYDCFLERRRDYVDCILCGVRWHSPEYPTCFTCRRRHPDRQEAARDLRVAILIRDDFQCRECNDRTELQIDHLRPCARGGTADPWNLQVLCGRCNRAKGATWWSGCKWDKRRTSQLADYFIGLRGYLDEPVRETLRTEVADWRFRNGHDSRVRWCSDWTERGAALLDEMEVRLTCEGEPYTEGRGLGAVGQA